MGQSTYERLGTLYISIDCAPGSPRPDTYIAQAAAIFNISEIDEPVSKCFGAWTWHFPDYKYEDYLYGEDTIAEHLNHLCNSGRIRGAEWGWLSDIDKYLESKKSGTKSHLMFLTTEEIRGLLPDDDMVRFDSDYDFAVSIIDEIFNQSDK